MSKINEKDIIPYMEFVKNFHQTIRERNIILVYEGEITQVITKAFSSMTEQNSDVQGDSTRTQKRLYNVMIESLQNIAKHASNELTGKPMLPGRGIFLITNTNEEYVVTTGNIIGNETIEETTQMLEKFNHLDKEEVKVEYKKMIKASRLSEKAGAGLGLIDIVKKTGNKIEYHFSKINDKTSFFIQQSVINRD